MFGTLELRWIVTGSINIMGVGQQHITIVVWNKTNWTPTVNKWLFQHIKTCPHPDYWYLNQIHHIQEIDSGLIVFPLCNFLGEIFFNCLEFSFLFDCRLYRIACAPISNEIISQKAETRHNQPLAALYLPFVSVFVSANLEFGRNTERHKF